MEKNNNFFNKDRGVNIDLCNCCPLECPRCRRQTAWKNFEENLRNHTGPKWCLRNCKIVEGEKFLIRKDTWINVEDGTVIRERSA